MKRKNIVMILADQMHKKALGQLDPQIITPNLDQLAREGITFNNAYSNNPVCGPFRGNLFTGMYTCDNKVYKNNDPLPRDVTCMADAFNANGYETSFVGKWHLGGHGNEPIPKELRGGFKHFIGYQCYNGFLGENKFYDEEDKAHTYDGHRTDITTDLAIDRLKVLADSDHAFLHVVFYQAPHYPEQPRDHYAHMYEGVTFDTPPNYRDVDPYTPTNDPRSPRPFKYCKDYQRYGNDMQTYKQLYNAMVTQIDDGVGRLMDVLKEKDLYDDTMILFSADHGDLQGSHGLLNKCQPYEESCGIPLILKGDQQKGTHVKIPVSSIDYYKTAMAYGGIADGPHLEGRDLFDLSHREKDYIDDVIYAENYESSDQWQMIRDYRNKLVVPMGSDLPSLLFDLESDPYELENLVNIEKYSEVKEKLVTQLMNWRLQRTTNKV